MISYICRANQQCRMYLPSTSYIKNIYNTGGPCAHVWGGCMLPTEKKTKTEGYERCERAPKPNNQNSLAPTSKIKNACCSAPTCYYSARLVCLSFCGW